MAVERFNFDPRGLIYHSIVMIGYVIWCQTIERFSNWKESKIEVNELADLSEKPAKIGLLAGPITTIANRFVEEMMMLWEPPEDNEPKSSKINRIIF